MSRAPPDRAARPISVTDFPAQIARCNTIRAASGLPSLDQEQAIRAAIRQWNAVLNEARDRLREATGHDLANNSFTFQIISRDAAPRLQTYFEDLARHDDPGRRSGRT